LSRPGLSVSDINEILCERLDGVDSSVGRDVLGVVSKDEGLLRLRNNHALLALVAVRSEPAAECLKRKYLLRPQARLVVLYDGVFLAVDFEALGQYVRVVLKRIDDGLHLFGLDLSRILALVF
jgi:hypothetical protein